MPTTTDWITAIAGIFSALAGLISAAAIYLLWKQTSQLKQQTTHAGKQVDLLIEQNKFTATQVELLIEQNKFTADELKFLTKQDEYTAQQVKLLSDEVKSDHERSRRENAIDLIFKWTEHMQRESTSARKFVESLDSHQALKLYKVEPLTLSLNPIIKGHVATCLAQSRLEPEIDEASNQLKLSEAAVSVIRWQAIKYLNTLESVLTAWRHNVADREMITEQFVYIFNPQKGSNAMASFREVLGGKDSFPSIALFIKHLDEKGKLPETDGKPPLF